MTPAVRDDGRRWSVEGSAVRRAAIGTALLLFALATVTTADPDLWGHLRFGLDTIRSHALTSIDPYSFTQDTPWINHEWLSELQMGLAWLAAGSVGLALLKGFLVFATLFLVWSATRGTELTARMVLIGAIALSMAPMIRTLRPQLWSALCLAALCRVLIADHRSARCWLPLLFVIWANLHGGWIVGLGVFSAWAFAEVLSNRNRVFEWSVVVVASAAATLVTPYGWTLWRFLWNTVGTSRQIGEWQPLWTAGAPKWVPWIATTFAAVWAIARTSRRRLHLLAVCGVLAYASLRVLRIWPLYVECAGIVLAPAMRLRWPARTVTRAQTREDLVAGTGILVVAAAIAAWLLSSSLRCIGVEGDWVPDPVAAHALSDAGPGRLVVFFDWGEYALWHWGPKLRVSMDGRRETVYSDRRLNEHAAILAGSSSGIAALDSWRAEYVWLPATSVRTREWLAAHGYRIEVETAKSFVAVRADLPSLAASGAPSVGARRCFPD